MVQREYAVLKDAQIKLGKEECVKDMVQRENANYAAVKDAQVLLRKEEYASNMVQK